MSRSREDVTTVADAAIFAVLLILVLLAFFGL